LFKHLFLSVKAGIAAGIVGIFLLVSLSAVIVILDASANTMQLYWLVELLHWPEVLVYRLAAEPTFFGAGLVAAMWSTTKIKPPSLLQSAFGGVAAGIIAAIISRLLPNLCLYAFVLVFSEHFYDPDPVGAARASYISGAIATLVSAIISGAIGGVFYTMFDQRRKHA
jgi:hypothetical protein